MKKLIDLSYVVDVCPAVEDVLELIDDEDLIEEINNRANDRFIKEMLSELDEETIELIKQCINESN